MPDDPTGTGDGEPGGGLDGGGLGGGPGGSLGGLGGGPGGEDERLVAGWDPRWSLTDVLADYRACDLFARYLVHTDAGRGTYHAALFGYCYLNEVGYLDAVVDQNRLAVRTMFDAACRHLAPVFDRFAAELRAASAAASAGRPAVIAIDSGDHSWHGCAGTAAGLVAALADLGFRGDLDLAAARRAGGRDIVVKRNTIIVITLRYEASGFRLAARLDPARLAAHNAAVLRRLRADRDTCRYLQLDGTVVLHRTDAWQPALMAFVRLCCRRRYGDAHPGVIERIGLGRRRDHIVIHAPTGPDPAPVHTLVATHHPRSQITVRPF